MGPTWQTQVGIVGIRWRGRARARRVYSNKLDSRVDTLEQSSGTFPRASLSGPGGPRVQAFGGICGCSHWIEQKEEGRRRANGSAAD